MLEQVTASHFSDYQDLKNWLPFQKNSFSRQSARHRLTVRQVDDCKSSTVRPFCHLNTYLSYSQPSHDPIISGCSADFWLAVRQLSWKSTASPCFPYSLMEMFILQMEKLCLHEPKTRDRSERTWGPFLAPCHITPQPSVVVLELGSWF